MAVKVRSHKHFFQVIYYTPYRKSSSDEGHLVSEVVFSRRSSSVEDSLPLRVVFRQRSSSVKGCLPSKVVFRQMSSSIKCCLPSNVVFRYLSATPMLLPILQHLVCQNHCQKQVVRPIRSFKKKTRPKAQDTRHKKIYRN